jgi:hypothetical protein
MTTADRTIQVVTAIGSVVVAIAGLWNAYQYAVLAGTVGEISRNLVAHLNAAGLH